MVSLINGKKNSVKASEVEMTQVVLPQYANSVGTVFGGQIVSWIDICAAVSGQRHCRSSVVTASIDSVNFIESIKQGHVVIIKSKLNAAFRSSMEIGTVVISENPLTGERKKAMKAYLTFVSIGLDGKPKKVPKLVLETKEDERRAKEALARRELRLKNRNS